MKNHITRTLAIVATLAILAIPIRAGTIEDVDASLQNQARRSVNTLRVASAVQDAETVTIGASVFEFDTTATAAITTGNVRVNVSGGSTATAVGTLTSSGAFTDGQTVVINGKTYTSQTTLTNTNGNFLIGANQTASHANLKAAVNLEAGSGTLYAAATTLHPTVTATAATGTTTVFAAKTPGTAGNALTTTETQTNAAFGAATLASGVDPTAAESTTALETAINGLNLATFKVKCTRIGANEIFLYNRKDAEAIAATETLAGTNNAFASATFYGGAAVPSIPRVVNMSDRAANATEVALGNAHFFFPFTPSAVTARVRSTAGAAKAWDGAITISAGRVTIDNSGSTDWIAGDIITVQASN